MTGVGIRELVWLVLVVLLGLGVVITWIIKSELSRNFFKSEIKKLKSQLASAEREKVMMIEEMQAFKDAATVPSEESAQGDTGSGNLVIGKMMERARELEKDNDRLKRELNEARSSLEEVYKALCSK
jgi:predicted RNase H-like nuclease (RuvC/YqgF family)